MGREFLGYFRTLGGSEPDQRVLDIGCGPGRMAIPLTRFLTEKGRYDGVDTWTEAVDWCAKNITPRFGNFNFSSTRRPWPRRKAEISRSKTGHSTLRSSVRYPSLARLRFAQYVNEAGRLLRPGGTYLGTSYIGPLSPGTEPPEAPDSEAGVKPWSTTQDVIFSQAQIEEPSRLERPGARRDLPGQLGRRPGALSYQDVIVAKKAEA